MKIGVVALIALAGMAFALAGCGDKPAENATPDTAVSPPSIGAVATPAAGAATVATGQAKGSIKVGDKALCAICAVKEGTKEPEEVKAVLDYKDKTYGFCNESEKAEFISSPAKYAN